MIDLAITSRVTRFGDPRSLITKAARHALAAEGFTAGNLSVAIVGARRMATIHQRFLNIAGPTDVITFDLDTDVDRNWIEGEVIVCADVAARQAGGQGASTRAVHRELALYVVHGILHLAGYDDHDPDDYARMHAREDELLRGCGIGAVFHRQARNQAGK